LRQRSRLSFWIPRVLGSDHRRGDIRPTWPRILVDSDPINGIQRQGLVEEKVG
jgi:hypothetical protein